MTVLKYLAITIMFLSCTIQTGVVADKNETQNYDDQRLLNKSCLGDSAIVIDVGDIEIKGQIDSCDFPCYFAATFYAKNKLIYQVPELIPYYFTDTNNVVPIKRYWDHIELILLSSEWKFDDEYHVYHFTNKYEFLKVEYISMSQALKMYKSLRRVNLKNGKTQNVASKQ